MLSLSASTTARNTAFSSWRTLPGQRCFASSASASAVTARIRLPSSAAKRARKWRVELGNVLGAFAQRRHRDREHVQPVEQVLAETAVLHVGDQVAVGGGDEPHVDLDRLLGADRLDLALLDGAKQLHLRRQRQLADLVEEQRAAGCLDELAGVSLGCAGEGALLVAEQDRLHEVFGDRAAVDGDEGPRAALARAVDGARDQLLADARLAFDQHRDARRRRPSRAVRSTACIAALRVMMSLKVSVPDLPRLMRASSSSSALLSIALRSDT